MTTHYKMTFIDPTQEISTEKVEGVGERQGQEIVPQALWPLVSGLKNAVVSILDRDAICLTTIEVETA